MVWAVAAGKCVDAERVLQAWLRKSRLILHLFDGLTKVGGWTRTDGFWIEVPGCSSAGKEIPG